MLRIEFEGNAEEILRDMVLLLGGAGTRPGERILNVAKSADGLRKLKELKEAPNLVAEAPKKAEEKPAKKEPAKSPEEHTTPEQLTKLRQVAVAFLRKDPKNHEILKKWLSVHGFERITKITPDKVDTFLAEFENA